MDRWSNKKSAYVENQKIDAFLREIVDISRKHGMSIGHEDGHGAFTVEPFSDHHAEWLLDAHDDTEED
jgi:hypothetical protein